MDLGIGGIAIYQSADMVSCLSFVFTGSILWSVAELVLVSLFSSAIQWRRAILYAVPSNAATIEPPECYIKCKLHDGDGGVDIAEAPWIEPSMSTRAYFANKLVLSIELKVGSPYSAWVLFERKREFESLLAKIAVVADICAIILRH